MESVTGGDIYEFKLYEHHYELYTYTKIIFKLLL